MNDSTNVRIIADNIRKLVSRTSNLEKAATRIPKNYSTDEIDIGLKWIDGRPIFRRVLSGDFGTQTTTFNQVFAVIQGVVPIDLSGFCIYGDESAYQSIEHYTSGYTVSSGNLYALALPVQLSGGKYHLIFDYVKVPAPSKSSDEPEEKKTKKTTKKG